MTILLKLPQLVGSREAADEILSGLPEVRDQELVLDCSDLISGSVSFADQLIVRLLEERGAARVSVVDASDEFWKYLAESAEEIGSQDRLVKGSRGLLLSR